MLMDSQLLIVIKNKPIWFKISLDYCSVWFKDHLICMNERAMVGIDVLIFDNFNAMDVQ